MTHRGYSLVMKMEQTKLIALKRKLCVVSMENGSEIQLLVYQEGYVRLFLEGGRIVWQRTGKHAIRGK